MRIDDEDQRVRDAARRDALGITTSELPDLRDAIAELARQHRLSANTVRLAYEVNLHAHVREAKLRFLAELPNDQRTGEPFLGIMVGGDYSSNTAGSPAGVSVRSTNLGFVAYEALEDGDLLVGVRTDQGLERMSHFGDLRAAFEGLAPGDAVEFLVVRGGSVVRVPLRLDERMERQGISDARWQMVETDSRRVAAAYWDEQIAPLLPPPQTPVARSE